MASDEKAFERISQKTLPGCATGIRANRVNRLHLRRNHCSIECLE